MSFKKKKRKETEFTRPSKKLGQLALNRAATAAGRGTKRGALNAAGEALGGSGTRGNPWIWFGLVVTQNHTWGHGVTVGEPSQGPSCPPEGGVRARGFTEDTTIGAFILKERES